MERKILTYKASMLAIFFLLASITWLCTSFLAHATPSFTPREGTSGTCSWKYTKEGDDIVLRIFPTTAPSGTLNKWVNNPDWSSDESLSDYYQNTKRVVIANGVKASTCYRMFSGFTSLQSVEFSNFDTTSVTNMSHMFRDCFKLEKLDLSKFMVSEVTDMSSLFYECRALTSVSGLSEWKTYSLTDMQFMFASCEALKSLNLTGWNTSKVTNMSCLFYRCRALTSVSGISGWNTRLLEDMHAMFASCEALKSLDLTGTGWDTSKVTNMHALFYQCHVLTSVGGLSNWDTGLVQDMSGIFRECYALKSLDLTKWNTEKVTDMYCLFYKCGALTSVGDLTKWQTGSVTNMAWMFCYCGALTSLDLTNWNTENVTNMYCLFYDCKALTSVGDLKNWNTKKVENMQEMFFGCKALKSLDLSNWTISEKTSTDNMFSATESLKEITLGNNFHVKDAMKLDEAGTKVGTHWAQVKAGTAKDSYDKIFASASELATFHNDRKKRQTDIAQYARITPNLVISFEKGADNVEGAMEPQSFSYNEKKDLAKNTYTREGHEFDGWQDSEGNSYTDGQLFQNTVLALHAQKTLTAKWKIKTYTIMFDANVPATETSVVVPKDLVVEHGKNAVIPSSSDVKRTDYDLLEWATVANGTGTKYQPGGTIEGVKSNVRLYAQWKKKEETKTDKQGGDKSGNGEKGPQPGKGPEPKTGPEPSKGPEPNKGPQPNNGPEPKTDPEPSKNPEPKTDPEPSKNTQNSEGTEKNKGGQEQPVRSNSKRDNGGQNKTGETNKKMVKLIYLSGDLAKGTVSRSSEELSNSGIPQGSTAVPKVGYEFVKWTKNTDPSWSYDKAALTRSVIESTAKKDGELIATNFTAHFAPKHRSKMAKTLQPATPNANTASQASNTSPQAISQASSSQGDAQNKSTSKKVGVGSGKNKIPGTGVSGSSRAIDVLSLGGMVSIASGAAVAFCCRIARKRTAK